MVKSIPQPRARLTLSRACVLAAAVAWLLPGTVGCGSADPNLFGTAPAEPGGSSNSAGASSSASSGGSSGTEPAVSGGGGGSVSGGNGSAASGSIGGSGGSNAGCAFSCGEGGRGGSIGLGGAGAGEAGTSDAGSPGSPECATFAADATYLPSTQHCYLVDTEQRNFAAAQAHCKTLDAHLVTLRDQAENDFAWSIHGDEHWIGSQDGKAAKQSGAGTYTWITDEPFDYTNWSPNQPNASKTDCEDGGACYEHCAFQWKGGDHDSQWNDRYCAHTIASICEWDAAPPPPPPPSR